MRRIWPSLIPWLEFLHPGNGHVPLNLPESLDYINVLIPVYGAFFQPAVHLELLDLLLATPSIYRMLMDHWLHLPQYKGHGKRYFERLDFFDSIWELVCAFRNAMLRAPSESHVDQARIDAVIKEQALVVADSRLYSLYESAIDVLRVCLDVAYEAEYCERVIYGHISTIQMFACDVPMLHCPRELVRSIVQLASRLPREDQRCMICNLMGTIWYFADNTRPMTWAIRDGILPLMLANNQNGDISYVFNLLARRSVNLPVARVLGLNGGPPSFSAAGLTDNTEYVTSLDGEILRRVEIARSLYARACSNSKCTAPSDAKAMRRCACFRAFYCSTQCQRAHRKAHKPNCADGGHGSLPTESPFRRPIDAFFVTKLVTDYLKRNKTDILASIDQLASTTSEPLFSVVTIELRGIPAPTHEIRTLEADAPELVTIAMRPGDILVRAVLQFCDRSQESTVSMLRLSVSELSDMSY
ncbi:hypothetical protein HDZ31DRAFT_37015 [Schizophyllum fasciatum]